MVFIIGGTVKQMIRMGWAVLGVAAAILGCDSQEEVLTSNAGLQMDDGTWLEWCPQSDAPTELLAFFDAARLGSGCKNVSTSCGASRTTTPGCGWDMRYCIEEKVEAITTDTLGCPATRDDISTGNWSSCDSAIAQGTSGQACSFGGSCTRATDDPCCVEVALCNEQVADVPVLQRNRVCAPGCATLTSNAQKSPVTDCAGAVAAEREFGMPCQPGLVCFSSGPNALSDVHGVAFESASLNYATMHFCANGMLMHAPNALGTLVF
jgi:hypothetical protein